LTVHALAVAVLEAIETGDRDLVERLALDALEDGDPRRRYECSACGLCCAAPGERDNHLLHVHGLEAAA
jgi:hypothetical protein